MRRRLGNDEVPPDPPVTVNVLPLICCHCPSMRKLTGTSGTPMLTSTPAFHPVFSSSDRSLNGTVAPPMMPKRTGLLTIACAETDAAVTERASPKTAAPIAVRVITKPSKLSMSLSPRAPAMFGRHEEPVRHVPVTSSLQEARMSNHHDGE